MYYRACKAESIPGALASRYYATFYEDINVCSHYHTHLSCLLWSVGDLNWVNVAHFEIFLTFAPPPPQSGKWINAPAQILYQNGFSFNLKLIIV